MKDINIVIDSQTHKVQFPDNFLGLNAENLQGNINFTFTNGFVNGIARLELSIDCESGFIPNLQNTGDSYTLPILSSLLTSDNIVMQLVIEQTDLITYKLTTDTSINHQKTYYTRSGVEGEYVYTIVENPKEKNKNNYYEAVNTIPDDYPTWIDTLNSLVGQVNAKIIEMNQALAEVDNLDITATKEGTTVTITITRKDGSQQVVTITDGKDGVGIEKIEKTDTTGLIDTYTIYYTDDSTSTFQVKNGRGIVSIDKTNTNILTDTYTITYNDDTTSTFYVVNGNGVESIEKTGTSGLIDTYRISYTNGEYYDYQVANGNGIDNIEKTDTTGLVDTYTITYTNGTTSTYIITNGNGISNIAKTSTVDNVDTYTIYYTNGTTSTFTVTNSTVTNQEFQELQRLVDYNALYANALIKMNNTGTDLTINDTAEAPMPMTLSPSALSQYTTTGAQLFNVNEINIVEGISIDNEGWITASYDNSSGTSTTFLNLFTQNINLSTSTNYNAFLEVKNVSGNGTVAITTSNQYSQFDSSFTRTFSSISANSIYNSIITTKASFDTAIFGLRSYVQFLAGQSGSITFRISLIANTAITPETFVYEPYTNGASPNPDYPQDIHTISGDNEIKVQNRNWFNNELEKGKYLGTNGQKATDDNSIRNANPILVENNQNYIFSNDGVGVALNVFEYKENMTFIKTSVIPANNSFITDNNTKYINFYKSDNLSSYKIQLEKGTTITPYTPHQEQSLPLNLPVENLFDISKVPTSTINITGTNEEFTILQKGNNTNTQLDIQFKENKQYTFSGYYSSTKANGSIRITYTDNTTDNVFAIFDNSTKSKTKFSFTSNSLKSISFVEFRLFSEGNYTIYNFQIEQGTKANSFTPYGTTPLEYCKIPNTNYEDEFVIPSGKNIIDFSTINYDAAGSATVTRNGNEYTVSTSTNEYGRVAFTQANLKLKPNTRYTLSAKVKSTTNTNGSRVFISAGLSNTNFQVVGEYVTAGNVSYATFTTPTTIDDSAFIGLYPGGKNYTATFDNIQLEVGAKTDYEPYNNGKWYLKKNTNKKIFNGSEEIIKNTNYSTETMLVAQNLLSNAKSGQVIISDYFKNNFPTIINSVRLAAQYLLFGLDINDFATVEDFKNWLSNHNTKVYYPLFTPEYILLNDTLQSQLTEIYNWLVSYQEQTNISQVNNDLPFIINTITCYDLNKLLTRVEVLESEV